MLREVVTPARWLPPRLEPGERAGLWNISFQPMALDLLVALREVVVRTADFDEEVLIAIFGLKGERRMGEPVGIFIQVGS